MPRRLAAAALACVLLAGACGDDGGSSAYRPELESVAPGGGGDGDDGGDGSGAGGGGEEQTSGIDLEGIPVDDQDDAIIEASLAEIEVFWEDAFPATYGEDFTPVRGGFHAYGPARVLPRCGGFVRYEEIAANAFYCPPDDLIAWDTDNLTNVLLDEFGPFTLVIVMAHEYGHAVQARVPVGGPTIALEQQADCFAGAFTSFVADGGSDVLAVSVDDLDLAVAGFLVLRDNLGTPASDPRAHGSAFDRVGAFQDGFLNGAERCAAYEEIYDSGGSTVVDLPLPASGQVDAPFDPNADGNIFDITLGSLETFWTEALPARFDTEWAPLSGGGGVVPFDPDDESTLPDCPGDDIDGREVASGSFTCVGDPGDPDDDVVAFDIDLVAEQYTRIGDFAVSGIISREYSRVAQARIGADGDDRALSLQADCFSGAWAGDFAAATLRGDGQDIPGLGPVFLTAGDLDEGVQSFLLLGERAGPAATKGTPFDRIAAFRDGFFRGLPRCAAYLDGDLPDADDNLPAR